MKKAYKTKLISLDSLIMSIYRKHTYLTLIFFYDFHKTKEFWEIEDKISKCNFFMVSLYLANLLSSSGGASENEKNDGMLKFPLEDFCVLWFQSHKK